MKRARRVDRVPACGFTLIELIVAMSVVAILSVVAVPSFRSLYAQSEMRTVSNELSLSLMRARSEATKRSSAMRIVKKGEWTNGWEIRDATNAVVAEQGAVRGITFTSAPASVLFLSSGRVTGNPDDCSFTLTSTRLPSLVRCVSIDAGGGPSIEEGACT